MNRNRGRPVSDRTPSEEPEPPYCDWIVLEHAIGDPAVAQRLLKRFTEIAPQSVSSLTRALSTNDRASALRVTQGLTEVARLISAAEVHRVATMIERLTEASDLAAAEHELARLERAIQECCRAINEASAD